MTLKTHLLDVMGSIGSILSYFLNEARNSHIKLGKNN